MSSSCEGASNKREEKILTEIEDMPWGERLFYAEDSMGGRISFVDQNTLFTGPDSEI